MAIGFALQIAIVPAAGAQEAKSPGTGTAAAPGTPADGRQAGDAALARPEPEAGPPASVSVAVPIGSVTIGPEFVAGGPGYGRRSMVREGVIVLEISSTPVMADLASGPDSPADDRTSYPPNTQPASW